VEPSRIPNIPPPVVRETQAAQISSKGYSNVDCRIPHILDFFVFVRVGVKDKVNLSMDGFELVFILI
jgi:hypothetical protein